jgi:hypothetical protein
MFAVLTANVAMAFALAGWYGSEQYVMKYNFSRVLEVDMIRLESKILTTRPGSNPEDEARRDHDRAVLLKQIGWAAGIACAWKHVMYIVATMLELAALASATTRHGRTAHIVAAWAILVSTVLTVVAMIMLVKPAFGGIPSLSIRAYLYATLLQGGYGAILLAVFFRRRRPETQ